MKTFNEWIETKNELPPAPGTSPIKEGYVRLYHQTTENNLKKIEKKGLLYSHAKGIEGPKSIYATKTPFYNKANDFPTLEFQIPEDKFEAPQYVLCDVMPNDFIAVHYPWHEHARYIENEPEALESTLAGDHDHLLKYPTWELAIKYIKTKYRK